MMKAVCFLVFVTYSQSKSIGNLSPDNLSAPLNNSTPDSGILPAEHMEHFNTSAPIAERLEGPPHPSPVGVTKLQNQETDSYKILTPILGTMIPLLAIAAVVASGVWRKCRKRKRSVPEGTSGTHAMPPIYVPGIVSSETLRSEFALQKYVNLLEIPLTNLEIGELLGWGVHGMVRKGLATGLRGFAGRTLVAVKSVKRKGDVEQHTSLTSEIKILTKAGRHLNILNLLGAVVKGETLLLTEFCTFGSLKEFLHRYRRSGFSNQVDALGNIVNLEDEDLHRRGSTQELILTEMAGLPEMKNQPLLTTDDLINFAFQIARGMHYLASRSIIHRDLAARNVLVMEGSIMKISDFGMARQQDVYVLTNSQVALPMRWMPPESIIRGVYSQKSDVWSFGILLHEIHTLGETPYRNLGKISSTDFVSAITQGMRMERPAFCPTTVYNIMQKCWEFDAESRPVFDELKTELCKQMPKENMDVYLLLDEPYQKFNTSHHDILDEVVLDNENCSVRPGEN